MGNWYWIGAVLGIGVGLGVLFAGALAGARAGLTAALAAVAAATAGVLVGLAVDGWVEAGAGGVGGVLGAAGSAQLVQGALRRGGTRLGTALLVGGGALVIAALALVPALGYVEAVAVPAVAARLRRRTAERYAGLRSLARD